MKYHLLSAALIGAAVLLELSGVANGRSGLGATLFTGGVACEIWFWIGHRVQSRKTGVSEVSLLDPHIVDTSRLHEHYAGHPRTAARRSIDLTTRR